MIAKEDRIFVVNGLEYRIRKNQSVGDLPEHVKDQLVKVGLVDAEKKSTGKTGRRKK